ncbi:uncharacterized protein PGTG_22337 [Puccinia graminis f. sp. tritici CRL 75-36-700-3]|uniref:DDE Tnp4 domain-containing protein n=1 Tax=Puccinia graminis f. sp. tritici (strain CRL 75-36-700-3 / race SCCL) TaxID=418459 RepID=H6QUI9_PUCGT|nr:uncharacterized protein PGTG_22337 [Puccinia graminis f. sp. tritici CRL 75-36-700-3]EHS64701.1 hypothetical protein PGTG_22337 [Puccinia graminis f. sp. tritici CRL 75-36-700-3]
MRQPSERQQLIKDIFLILVFLDLEDTDNHLDQVLNIPQQPSFGSILFPNNPNLQLSCDRFLGDEAWLEALLQVILSCRYLNDRSSPRTHGNFDLDRLFNMRDEDFKQSVRTTKEAFLWLLDQISLHPVFHSQSHRPQLPIPHQLALTLERLGSNGNGASVGRFSRNLTVGRGTVIKVSRRVIEAINSLSSKHVVWPDRYRRAEISEVMKDEGFPGCVGFVDGTTIPLHQRPGLDGEVYWDRKKKYSVNCQIVCDCDRYITSFTVGWPGSCGDSWVFRNTKLHTQAEAYFDAGQFLIADSAYGLSCTTIPAYKAPASNKRENADFNYCLAKSRVRNEHTIGILKGRWASLQQLRLHLHKKSHMKEIIRWVSCCVTLHNMLSNLGDAWEVVHRWNGGDEDEEDEVAPLTDTESSRRRAELFRNCVQEKCLAFHRNQGTI